MQAIPLYPHVEFSGIKVNRQEMLRYLGYRGQQMEPDLVQSLERCAALVEAAAAPRFVAAEYPCVPQADAVQVAQTLLLPGIDIQMHLEHSERCVLMAATLGYEVERVIQYHKARSMTEAVMLDAAATALIEQVCDALEEQMRLYYQASGWDLTDRFSCGYGDLPIEVQPGITGLLQSAKTIGLTCSSSLILIPRKSVTAILGVIRPGQRRSIRGCQNCKNKQNCAFRKDGITCGHSQQITE